MKKTISFLALSFFASFAAACASAPMDEDDADLDAKVETAAAGDPSQWGVSAAGDPSQWGVRARAGDTAALTCPGAGTCAKADAYCDGDPSNSWCQILDKCTQCYGAAE
jgi:hypothetical protein